MKRISSPASPLPCCHEASKPRGFMLGLRLGFIGFRGFWVWGLGFIGMIGMIGFIGFIGFLGFGSRGALASEVAGARPDD